MDSSSEMDERTMLEIYLPTFEKVVKENQLWTVMAAYNDKATGALQAERDAGVAVNYASGYDYESKKAPVLFTFGYDLSYTEFVRTA